MRGRGGPVRNSWWPVWPRVVYSVCPLLQSAVTTWPGPCPGPPPGLIIKIVRSWSAETDSFSRHADQWERAWVSADQILGSGWTAASQYRHVQRLSKIYVRNCFSLRQFVSDMLVEKWTQTRSVRWELQRYWLWQNWISIILLFWQLENINTVKSDTQWLQNQRWNAQRSFPRECSSFYSSSKRFLCLPIRLLSVSLKSTAWLLTFGWHLSFSSFHTFGNCWTAN